MKKRPAPLKRSVFHEVLAGIKQMREYRFAGQKASLLTRWTYPISSLKQKEMREMPLKAGKKKTKAAKPKKEKKVTLPALAGQLLALEARVLCLEDEWDAVEARLGGKTDQAISYLPPEKNDRAEKEGPAVTKSE